MKIIYFDGECLLCHGFVRFLWRHDLDRKLNYAPLQGSTAEKFLPEILRKNLNTVVFANGDHIFKKSDAVVAVLKELGGRYKLMGFIIKLVPKCIRDFGYDIIAGNRHQWFGRSNECLFIKDSDQQYFLK